MLPQQHLARVFPAGFAPAQSSLRGSVHQVISYCELLIEESNPARHGVLLDQLDALIGVCQRILRAFAVPNDPDLSAMRSWFDVASAEAENCASECLRWVTLIGQTADDPEAGWSTRDISRFVDAAMAVPDATERVVRVLGEHDFASQLSRKEPSRDPGFGPSPAELASATAVVRGLVLVVDDNEDNREILARRLMREGCEVMLAENGRQALRMLRRYEFDLALLDLLMPKMDGLTLLGEIRADPQLLDLPVVVISAVEAIESVVGCIEAGADDYLTKPFNPVLLKARVSALLERRRLRKAEKQRTQELNRLLEEVEERRQESDSLLRNILPESIARELQQAGTVQPTYYEDVSICFADIVGFSASSEELPADDLVRLLHEYFSRFDRIMQAYGLEKLKTIGDCYMFAGGLPERSPSHPVDAVLASFAMIREVQSLRARDTADWQVRIGLHLGPVIAGVVGIHKFAFDVWGETVNYAKRVECCGLPSSVNLSNSMYLRVKDFFKCDKRENIVLKDGRHVSMYSVEGIADSLMLKADSDPPASFAARYRTYFKKDPRILPLQIAAEQAPESSLTIHREQAN